MKIYIFTLVLTAIALYGYVTWSYFEASKQDDIEAPKDY